MTTVTLEEAQAKLPELIEQLAAGEGLLITGNEQSDARLTAEEKPKSEACARPGSAKGLLTILADDDEHLKDFAEYME